MLSHIKDLTYLDYRRVYPADVQAAMEQHQVCVCAACAGVVCVCAVRVPCGGEREGNEARVGLFIGP